MANHKSAIKRIRQNSKRNARNTAHRTQIKTVTKKALAAVASNNKEEAEKALKLASKTISKIASKGVIHKRAASRKISGLAKRVHKLLTAV